MRPKRRAEHGLDLGFIPALTRHPHWQLRRGSLSGRSVHWIINNAFVMRGKEKWLKASKNRETELEFNMARSSPRRRILRIDLWIFQDSLVFFLKNIFIFYSMIPCCPRIRTVFKTKGALTLQLQPVQIIQQEIAKIRQKHEKTEGTRTMYCIFGDNFVQIALSFSIFAHILATFD